MKEKLTLAGKEYLMEEGIYTPIVKENSFERQGGTYKMEELEEGMEVLIPNMAIPKEIDLKKLNRWGRMRLNFLKENKEEDYQIMYLQGTLMDHLLSKEKEIEDFITREEVKMMETWGLTEELKEEDYLKYLRLKKNMDMTLQEIGEREIILI
ncbi:MULTISPECIES: TnpV protein [Bacillota]|uniref:TnpV protein n=1 Tax=Bacillota TaxID=1239 RepID=UPI0004ACC37E|nr:TnpV protein [Clostridioides difficile]MCC9822503.1 TnpV protein [Streptococcus agalactiae]TKW62167.1 MAG: TnpV protein [Gemella sp.]HBM7176429.1 TnpV protein [Enterococcus faecium]HCT6703176.1 TnpV protein [Enterococcus faecalis]HEP3702243.1 TnpV protein [Streptococcus pyogenes]HEW8263759.1 TnpV protein [Streptococcus pneumoniae]